MNLFREISLIIKKESEQKDLKGSLGNLSNQYYVYNPVENSIYIIFNPEVKEENIYKDDVLALITCGYKININSIHILVHKTNQDYSRIIQSLLTVGFQPTKSLNFRFGNLYNIFKIDLENECDLEKEICEVDF